MRRMMVGGSLAILIAGLSAPAALASRGAALDTGRITVETPLSAGGTYRLARITVINPGSEKIRYQLGVSQIETDARSPDTAWFSFSPSAITLGANREKAVTITLRLPQNATAGEYQALVEARAVSSDSGVALNVAAAARLEFTVGSASSGAQANSLTPLDGLGTWWWPVGAGAASLIGLVAVGRRFRIRLEHR
jgi:hypothetical protein